MGSFVAGCFGNQIYRSRNQKHLGDDIDRSIRRSERPVDCRACQDARVLFFPDKAPSCKFDSLKIVGSRGYGCLRKARCPYLHANDESSLKELIKLLNSARKSISVCVYKISEENLTKVLIHLKNVKRIRVRLIAHSDRVLEYDTRNMVPELREANIEIKLKTRTSKSQSFERLMHHKYRIIDMETVIHGSFNWTAQAVKNYENVSISKCEKEVIQYWQHFNRLWNKLN